MALRGLSLDKEHKIMRQGQTIWTVLDKEGCNVQQGQMRFLCSKRAVAYDIGKYMNQLYVLSAPFAILSS